MDAVDKEPREEWLDPLCWERLQQLETQHRRLQSECDLARRGLERVDFTPSSELRDAWKHYCEVIAELDQTTAQIEVLRVAG